MLITCARSLVERGRGAPTVDSPPFPHQELIVMNAPLGRRAAYAAEMIGTFGLVLFIVLILTISAPPPLGIGIGGPNFAVVGLVHAFALMLLIAALGGACAGHFNPAVTVGMLATRRIGLRDAGAYIVMQLIGGVLAVLVV